jgi:hypothetical protein
VAHGQFKLWRGRHERRHNYAHCQSTAAHLQPGVYGPGVAFTNVSNGHGSTIRTAILRVRARSSAGSVLDNHGGVRARPSAGVLDNRGGYLLDGYGGYLLNDGGERLLAR